MADPTTDAPPRRRRRAAAAGGADAAGDGGAGASGAASSRASAPPRTPPKLEGKLEQLIVTPALIFKARGDDYCANVIVQGAPALAQAWADLAKESPAVRKTLERMLEGGAWGGVIISTLCIALPIAQHHGAYPADWPNPFIPAGMTPPPPQPPADAAGNSAGNTFHPSQPEQGVNATDSNGNGNANGRGSVDPQEGAGPFVERVPPDLTRVGNPAAS